MVRFASIILLAALAGACSGDELVVSSTGTEPTREFDVVLPNVDTDWPIGVEQEDTDIEDTDVGDTDVGDTDVGDTDVGDTDVGDTDVGDTDAG